MERNSGAKCYKVIYGDSKPCRSPRDCPLLRTLETATHASAIHVHCDKDGREFFAEVSTSPVRDDGGKIAAVIHTSRDVTAVKQDKQNLRQFRDLLDQTSEAIFVEDPETGRFCDVNAYASRSLGYSREKLLRMRVQDIEAIISDDASWKRHVDDVRKKGTVVLEGRHKRKDGMKFWVEANVKLIRQQDRDYMVAAVRDISERKKTEEQLTVFKRLAETAA